MSAPFTPRIRKACDMLWIRHGETDDNVAHRIQGRSETSLNANGRQQVERLAEHLSVQGSCALWCSPMKRAVETAQILASRLSIAQAQVFDGVVEIELGRFVGRRLPELAKDPDWQNYLSRPYGARFPGGESFEELSMRVKAACQYILEHENADTILVVSHGGVMACLLSQLMGIDEQAYHRLRIANAHAIALRFQPPERVRLLGVNVQSIGQQ